MKNIVIGMSGKGKSISPQLIEQYKTIKKYQFENEDEKKEFIKKFWRLQKDGSVIDIDPQMSTAEYLRLYSKIFNVEIQTINFDNEVKNIERQLTVIDKNFKKYNALKMTIEYIVDDKIEKVIEISKDDILKGVVKEYIEMNILKYEVENSVEYNEENIPCLTLYLSRE